MPASSVLDPQGDQSARLAAIVECSADAIVSIDLDGVITSWNHAAERLFGYTTAEVIGTSAFELIEPRLRAKARSFIARARAGERLPLYETLRVRKDGTLVPVSVSLSAVRGPDGEPTGLAAIYYDLTERKCLEERLRQAQKMEAVGRLAGGVAHDFNNLLTVINGFAEILQDQLPLGDRRRDMAGEIRKAGQRAAELTQQLLAFSRRQIVAPRVLDLNVVVADLERMLRRLIGEDVELATVLRSGVGRVDADPGQLEQVILNLAVNARDAMPRGGKLTIETGTAELDEEYARIRQEVRPGQYALLAVSDSGCGMTDEVKARLFEPFFTTKEPGSGTGLGLATVYGIVKQARGHVEVYSEAGRGTTFKVYLPVTREASAEVPPPAFGGDPPPTGAETLLLAEDEAAVRGLAREVLRSLGYTVLEAATGAEALRVCEAHPGPVHLLVSDVVMPGGVSGRELAERSKVFRPRMPVLFISGYTDDAVMRHGVLQAQMHFLQKPFTPTALARKVREVLDTADR
jgi:two-component system, cell cycle sensor histidine kinase and response regulator CckA